MKKIKCIIASALAVITVFSASGCSSIIKTDDPFQKEMHQSESRRISDICETQDGYYILFGSYAYFIDKETKKTALLCTKPECAHNDETCNAFLSGYTIFSTADRLFYSNASYVEENGEFVNRGERLYSVALDGNDRKFVQDLEFEPSGNSTYSTPILHKGYVYFVYCGILYRMPLGGNINENAEALWGNEVEKDDRQIFDSIPVGHNFTLWADGDNIYVMTNVQQSDGTYKDILYAYSTTDESVKEVWRTPDADVVGEWTSAGVEVSKWYIKDGYIYFYLSGNDYWRCKLGTEEYEKLADTYEKTPYGKALFNDEYMCLLNSEPEEKGIPGYEIAGSYGYDFNNLIGGDTFFVYGIDGSFKCELSLGSLYEELPDLDDIAPVFIDDNEIWFVTQETHYTGDTGVMQGGFLPVGGVKTYDFTLCCVNINSGEITRVNSWHRE